LLYGTYRALCGPMNGSALTDSTGVEPIGQGV
jgi:hypothetical protein